jgi:phosphoribosyl 1,2-cyclic phosphate phosphodiesterase
VRIDGAGGPIDVLPIRQFHGDIESLAFRFGNVAYSPDVSALPLDSIPLLEDLDIWIVDALRYTSHPSHFSVKEAMEHVTKLRAKRAILTHMTGDLDYDTLRRELPGHVEPAYDNMVIEA